MNIPKQIRQQAKRLFRLCLTDGQLNADRVREIVDRVLEGRPRGYLGLLTHLQHLVQLEEERRAVLVESATALDEPVQSAIRRHLERRYGVGLSFQFTAKPSLLGGVRVQVGSDVYDSTVRARLNRVRQAFESE